MFENPSFLLDKLIVAYARRTPDHLGKLRIIRWVVRRFNKGTVTFTLPSGGRMRIPTNDYIGHSILHSGSYERESLALVHRIVGLSGTLIDVGANFGLYAATIADVPTTTVLAVEPDAENFIRLRSNCEGAVGRNCILLNAAVSSSEQIVSLELPAKGNRGTMRVSSERIGDIFVPAVTLRSALDAARITRVDLMKVDVEGFEKFVFEGCPLEGPLRPKNILIEYTSQGERVPGGWTARDMKAFFEKQGYVGRTVSGTELSDTPPEDNAWFSDSQGALGSGLI